MKSVWGAVTVIALSMAGCSIQSKQHEVHAVDGAGYGDLEKCWIDKHGKLSAFLVVARDEGHYRAIAVSHRCFVQQFGGDATQDFPDTILTLSVSDRANAVLSGGAVFAPNSETDLRIDLGSAKVFKLEQGEYKYKSIDNLLVGYLEIGDRARLEQLSISATGLYQLSPQARQLLFDGKVDLSQGQSRKQR